MKFSLSDLLKHMRSDKSPSFPGVLPDTRSNDEKARDYLHEEIVRDDHREELGAMYEWREKMPSQWKRFPIKNQDGSSSCVGQAIAKALGIHNNIEEDLYVDLSAAWIYAHRSNYPGEGMIVPHAMQFVKDFGATLEYFMPTNGKSEQELNAYYGKRFPVSIGEVAKIYKPGNFVTVISRDINEIAALLEKRPLVMGFAFDYNEWTEQPQIITNAPKLRHLVCAIEGTLYNGQKRIIIDDSWKEEATILGGKRLISQEFLTQRCFSIGYFIDLSNTWQSEPDKPRVNFTRDLTPGMRSDQDVKILQDVLKYEKLFPIDQDSTGNYFGLTQAAVSKLRVKYGMPEGTAFSADIRAIINKQYK